MPYSAGAGVMIGFAFGIVVGIVHARAGVSEDGNSGNFACRRDPRRRCWAAFSISPSCSASSIIRRIFLDRGIWAAAVSSVTLPNLDALDRW